MNAHNSLTRKRARSVAHSLDISPSFNGFSSWILTYPSLSLRSLRYGLLLPTSIDEGEVKLTLCILDTIEVKSFRMADSRGAVMLKSSLRRLLAGGERASGTPESAGKSLELSMMCRKGVQK